MFKVSQGTGRCEIGALSFSKIVLNSTEDAGILYYEFVCGEKCGKGELLIVERKQDKWAIAQRRRLWIF